MLQNFAGWERMRRFFFRLAAGFACALAPAIAAAAPSSPTPSAAQIVDKVATAYGGRAVLASIKNKIIVVQLTIGGQPATATTTIAAPNKYVTVIDIPGMHAKVARGYDGSVAWSTDSYGVVSSLTGTQATALVCEAADANDSDLFPDRWPTTVKELPSRTVDGKKYLVLSTVPKGCDESTSYVDPQTYLIMRVEAMGQTSAFSDFQTGPAGEKYAKSIVITGPMGVVQAAVTSIQDNVTLDPATFTMPTSGSPAPSPASATPAPPAATPSARALRYDF